MVQSHDHVVGLISFLFRNGRLMAVNLSSVWFFLSATYVNIDLRLSSYYYGKMKLYILCTALLISRLNVRKGVNVIGQMLVDFYENHRKQCIIKSPIFFMWRLVMVECYITCNWRVTSNKHLSAIALFYARYPRSS